MHPQVRYPRAFAVLLLAVAWGSPAEGQLATAAITGAVHDETGGAIPGVTVVATNQDTGRIRTTITSDQGGFRLDGLAQGRYTVTAELMGFDRVERRNILLEGSTVATVNIRMIIGGLATAVDVVAASAPVNLVQQELRTPVDAETMDSLPISGRRFQDFAHLAPGVGLDYGSTRVGTTDAIAFFGFNQRFKSLYVDGVDLNDELTGGGTGITDAPRSHFSMEAVEEVEVLRNQFSAEVGRQQAGVVNIITKSGTNDLRGRAFGFLRHDSFDKPNAFATGTLPFHQIQTGGHLGGPIVKDQSHFFGSYEFSDSEQVSTISIPPALVGFIPDARTEVPASNSRHNFFSKLSHSFGPAHFLNVSFLHDRWEADGQAAQANAAADARFRALGRDYFLVTRLTSTLGPTMLNELRVSYSRSSADRPVAQGRPALVFPGLLTGTPNNMPQARTQNNFIVSNVVSRQATFAGDHALRMGGEVNIVRYPTNLNLFQFGQFTFARAEPPGPNNPPTQYILGRYAFDFADLHSNFYGLFIQDDYRIAPRLTLNLGLRYDIETYLGAYDGENYPAFANRDEAIRFLLSTSPGGENAQTLYKSRESQKGNIQPRVGFNWTATADGRTSVRGGVGRFVEAGHDPISVQGTLRHNRAQTFVAPGALFDLLSFFPNEPSPDLLNQFIRISLISQFPGVFVEDAYATTYTLGAERDLGWGMGLAVDYAVIRSRHNGRTVNVNHPDASGVCPYLANCASVPVNVSDGRLDSNALQVQLRRRFGGTLGFLVSYTNLDARGDGPSTSPFLRDEDFGPTPNDVRHRMSAAVQTKLPFDISAAFIVTTASGFPYNMTAGVDTTGDRNSANNRPPGETYNSLRADGYFNTDLRLGRSFRFGTRQLDLMWEMFNLTNRANYNNYIGAVASPFFQQPVQALAPFQGQFGVRFNF